MSEPKVNIPSFREDMELQNAALEGELTRGFYVSTEIENIPSKTGCGMVCGTNEQRLTHKIHSFTKPIPVAAGQVKLNSADELIGKPIIKQRLNEIFNENNNERELSAYNTNKFLSFGVSSFKGMNTNSQLSYRSTSSFNMPTNRSYTYLSSIVNNGSGVFGDFSDNINNERYYGSFKSLNKGFSQFVYNINMSSKSFLNSFTSLFNGICSCPGFISVCKNSKVKTIEQETVPSDSDFAESDSENDDAGLTVAQEEQN
ncbi:hypothetical protein FG386_001471 [Cryptosporidium ryanae]|uniref:uncharacterized protein n=1 Tax=Cryptosporidium ryanae TaxID=515981 RepID=UPI00351AA807|nr:hypothetical protein FG386_001471 [Cryptosporidium ryanae]